MKNKRVMFRVDSSPNIGIGHVMRCIALSAKLKEFNWECFFFTKDLDGNLFNEISELSNHVTYIPCDNTYIPSNEYDRWLSSTEEYDAKECIKKIDDIFDVIVVDSYSLSCSWESLVRPYCKKLVVLDDLANRVHDCDVLIDVTLGRLPVDYNGLVSSDSVLLLGVNFALIRQEFITLRNESKLRRSQTKKIETILINFGGTDPYKLSLKSYESLISLGFKGRVIILISSSCEWIDELIIFSKNKNIILEIDSSNVSNLMLNSDLAVGAAGGASWERCCVGLPAVIIPFIENQINISKQLEKKGAVIIVEEESISKGVLCMINDEFFVSNFWSEMSEAAFNLVDGSGIHRIAREITHVN